MDDIEAVCQRLIMIDQGKKLFDGTLEDFRSKYNDDFTVKLEFDTVPTSWQESSKYELLERDERHWLIKSKTEITAKAAMIDLIGIYDPVNLYVQEERIEDIVRRAYAADEAV